MLSPRSRQRKSKLSGMLSRKAFQKDGVKDDSPRQVPKKEHKEKEAKEKYPDPVFAECYNELTKDLQRYAQKAKIDPEIIDQNWYAATQVFRFAAKCRVISMQVSF